jgi:hypothetical protein
MYSKVRINPDGKLLNSASRQALDNYIKGKAYKANIPKNLTPVDKKEWLAEYNYKIKQLREQDAKENPIGSADELIARAYKEGLVDGKNHATKDSHYTREAPRELKLAYLDGYSKGKRENPHTKSFKSAEQAKALGKKHALEGSIDALPSYVFNRLTNEVPFGQDYYASFQKTKYEMSKKKNSTVRINPMLSKKDIAYIKKNATETAISDSRHYRAPLKYVPEHFYLDYPQPGADTLWLKIYSDAYHKAEHDFQENPNRHYPRTPRGRPTKGYWWILDFFDTSERKIGTSIGQGPKEEATREAKDWVGLKYKKKLVAKVLLSGPYNRKPTKSTVRV